MEACRIMTSINQKKQKATKNKKKRKGDTLDLPVFSSVCQRNINNKDIKPTMWLPVNLEEVF